MDGVRMTWNVWPRTKVEESKCVIPLAASISPIRRHSDIPSLPYAPLKCHTCVAVLTAFDHVDSAAKIWICPFCFQRNHFPSHYHMVSETNLPGELYPQYTTVEYAIPYSTAGQFDPRSGAAPLPLTPPPVFVFVRDTCMINEELGFAKSALKQAIGLLPENVLVEFVSFGTQTHVHELGFSEMSKVFVFKGIKEVSKDQLLDQLGLSSRRTLTSGFPKGTHNGFLLPASDCEYTRDLLLDELQTDQWPSDGNVMFRGSNIARSLSFASKEKMELQMTVSDQLIGTLDDMELTRTNEEEMANDNDLDEDMIAEEAMELDGKQVPCDKAIPLANLRNHKASISRISTNTSLGASKYYRKFPRKGSPRTRSLVAPPKIPCEKDIPMAKLGNHKESSSGISTNTSLGDSKIIGSSLVRALHE